MTDPKPVGARGSFVQDGCLGCLGYISFQLLAAIVVAVVGYLALRGDPGDYAAIRAFSTLENLIGVAAGFLGFFIAFSASRAARVDRASVARQTAPVLITWGLLFIGLCGGAAFIALTAQKPMSEPEMSENQLSVVSLQLIAGTRAEDDDDPWEGVVNIGSPDGAFLQSVSWRHRAPLDAESLDDIVATTMPLLDFSAGAPAMTPTAITGVHLEGALTSGYSWTVAAADGSHGFLGVATTWDCPSTSLNVTLSTTGIGPEGAGLAQAVHTRSEQSALCLVAAATTTPRQSVRFDGGRSWEAVDVPSGGSQQWATKNSLSQVSFFSRRSSKIGIILKAGTPCLELLKVTAMDGIARQGATVPPGQPTRPEPSVEGCKFWMDAHVNVEGEPIPLTTFWELRDCHNGNHVFAGFYTFEAEKIGDPSALWSCGGAVESGAQ